MSRANNAPSSSLSIFDTLRRMAGQDFRLACPGTPDGPPLSAFGQFPGVPTKGQLSRWRNGHEYAPLVRLYRWVGACAELGVPKAVPLMLVAALRSAIEVAYASVAEADAPDLRTLMERASDADMAEEPAERTAWREGLSPDALRAYRPKNLLQAATSLELDAAIARELERG